MNDNKFGANSSGAPTENQQAGVSSRGRVLKRPGLTDKKRAALDSLRAGKTINPLDNYKTAEENALYERGDDDRGEDDGLADDFLVDDEGYGYADRGGDIWDYEDGHDVADPGRGKRRKKQAAGTHDIATYIKPVSSLSAPPKKAAATGAKAKAVAESKDIMDDLLDKLDDGEDEDLQDVRNGGLGNQAAAGASFGVDDGIMAFNKDEQLDLKYGATINSFQPAVASKKRGLEDISHATQVAEPETVEQLVAEEPAKKRFNPFAKNVDASTLEAEIKQQDAEREEAEAAAAAAMEAVAQDEEMKLAEQQTPAKAEAETERVSAVKREMDAVDQEWQAITAKNEQERAQLMKDSNMGMDQQQHPLAYNDDGSLSFFWFDAHEEAYGAEVFLFGKVWQPQTKSFVSCALKVNGMERAVYFYPKQPKDGGPMTEEKEKALKNSMIMEFTQMKQNQFKKIRDFKCKFVSRKYAFEMPIPHGEHKFLKVKYSAQDPPLPAGLKGNTFECVFGAQQSMLELFILKRKIKGPCWLRIKGAKVNQNYKATWARHEVAIDNPKNVEITLEELNREAPPLTAVSFSLKTTRSADNTNEIAMISCMVQNAINQDGPTNDNSQVQKFSLIRRLDAKPWPYDLQQRLKQDSACRSLQVFNNEKQLVEALIARLFKIDPDVLVAHGLCGSVFEIILSRIQHLKVPHWSRIGRFKRQNVPNRRAEQGGYSGGAWLPRMASCGRLLVDTFLSSKELVRETNYDLTHLADKQLKSKRQDFDEDMLPAFYMTSDKILRLVEHTERDTFLTYKLMMHLNILPLTKQLTCIAGNLWYRSLQNARAERNEMLLLHEFRGRKFVCPDKKSLNAKERKMAEDEEDDGEKPKVIKGKRQKAKYGGGLVLEPKAGFYDNIVMMLDFNSLYPSIIQEYNLCFTTVERKSTKNFDGSVAKPAKLDFGDEEEEDNEEEEVQVPSGLAATKDAILPNVLKTLVTKRRAVKKQMKGEKDPVKYQQLNIRQTALKLTANSMYGCLGFTSSRFHAQAIAALITRTGRETLLRTKDIAETKLGFTVIYGDTDSIMINTGTSLVPTALQQGQKLKAEVNQLYKCLEIEIDGIFKSMLLLKKKKYAALTIENFGTKDEKISREIKGLDMVRRDWCPLSKTVGEKVLSEILSGKQRDAVLMTLNEYLSEIGENLKNGNIPLSQFIITKQLTRRPEDYSDAKSLPHVQVALRQKKKGKSDAELVNTFVPYVVCKPIVEDATKKIGLGDMAYSPEEYMQQKPNARTLVIDNDWYITQQLLPPVARLIEHVDGIETDFVAQCLGVDQKKYKFHQPSAANDDDEPLASIAGPIMKAETGDRLSRRSVATLKIVCPHSDCGHSFDMPTIYHKQEQKLSSDICTKCKKKVPQQYIENRVRLFIKQLQAMYYKGSYQCSDNVCQNTTRQLLVASRCNVAGCKARVRAKCTEAQVNDTLRYLQALFDVQKYLRELKSSTSMKDEQRTALENVPHSGVLAEIKRHIDTVLNQSSYNNVDLTKLFSFMAAAK